MNVTIFQSQKTQSKIPSSPYDNNQFYFETKKVKNIEDVYEHLVSYFILNIPLVDSLKTYRRKNELKNHFVKKLDYIILDIDKIKTQSDKELCIKFFKDNNYCCILGESRNPMNLKGVLKVNCTVKESKLIVKEINEKLNGYGNLDLTITNYASYQAPILKRNIYYKNLKGFSYLVPKGIEEQDQKENFTIIPKTIQDLCKKEFEKRGYNFHEKINNFYKVSHISEKKSPKGFRWYPENPFTVIHWNVDRNENIWEDVVKTEEYKEIIKQQSLEKIKEIIPKYIPNVNQRYLENNKEKVKDFLENKNILKIQSPMGTGKSTIIEEVIKQSDYYGYRILFITNRVSLADDISKKYQNIKHYLGTEIEGNNYEIGDNLVVQIDSLWKFSIKYFDVVILDEFSTLINQVLSLEKEGKQHKKTIIKRFFSLNTKKLVIADAILFQNQIDLFGKNNSIDIINGYRDDVKLEFFKQKDNFIYELLEKAKKEPISVSSGSITILKVIELFLEENKISYKTISSETSKEDKELIYKSFKNKKPIAQVVMYSPTITVGISNLNDVKVHYHYDSGNSVGVLASLQMIKRTRNAKEIKIFIDQRQRYLETNLINIENSLSDFSEMDKDGDIIGIESDGERLAVLIQTDNILENLHKDSFIELLKFQFKIESNIIFNNNTVPNFVYKSSKIVKDNEKNKNLNIFEKYKKLSVEEISEIEMKVYGTSKEEQLIKMFEFYKDDPLLKLLNKKSFDALIKEDIKMPGIIENFKNLVQDFGYDYMNKIKKIYPKGNFNKEYKKYGYKKIRNRWYLNKVLCDLIYNK